MPTQQKKIIPYNIIKQTLLAKYFNDIVIALTDKMQEFSVKDVDPQTQEEEYHDALATIDDTILKKILCKKEISSLKNLLAISDKLNEVSPAKFLSICRAFESDAEFVQKEYIRMITTIFKKIDFYKKIKLNSPEANQPLIFTKAFTYLTINKYHILLTCITAAIPLLWNNLRSTNNKSKISN
jgi:hypothetical protein